MESNHVPARILFFEEPLDKKELHVCPSYTTFVYSDKQAVTRCCVGKIIMHCYDTKYFKSRVY